MAAYKSRYYHAVQYSGKGDFDIVFIQGRTQGFRSLNELKKVAGSSMKHHLAMGDNVQVVKTMPVGKQMKGG